jgi:hypothetical protein
VVDKKLGFREVASIPGAHPDGALHVLVMTKEECRWLRGKNGEKVGSTGPA